MAIDEIDLRCIWISQKPVSWNRYITVNAYLRIFSIDNTIKRLHNLNPFLTISIYTRNNVRVSSNRIVLNRIRIGCIQNGISFDIFHIDIVIIFFSNLIVSVCDNVISIEVDTPLRIKPIFSKRFDYSNIFYLVIVQYVKFGYFSW